MSPRERRGANEDCLAIPNLTEFEAYRLSNAIAARNQRADNAEALELYALHGAKQVDNRTRFVLYRREFRTFRQAEIASELNLGKSRVRQIDSDRWRRRGAWVWIEADAQVEQRHWRVASCATW